MATIARTMAAAPPIIPPTTAPVCETAFDDVPVVVALTVAGIWTADVEVEVDVEAEVEMEVEVEVGRN